MFIIYLDGRETLIETKTDLFMKVDLNKDGDEMFTDINDDEFLIRFKDIKYIQFVTDDKRINDHKRVYRND